MRHLVNFGLLLSFLTLAATGILSWLFPFSLPTTRIHLIFGLLTTGCVVAHLAARMRYFAQILRRPSSQNLTPWHLIGLVAIWGALLAAAFYRWEPARTLVGLSYESRHRAQIVRASPQTGFLDDEHTRLISRQPGEKANVALTLHLSFPPEIETNPAIAVWAETKTGSMIETLFLDQTLTYSDSVTWHGQQSARHQILPIWRHRYTLFSGLDPLGKVDAFTGATPSHSFSLDDYLQLDEGSFVLMVEVNAPHDPNATYPDPHLGQPSVLYSAFIDLSTESPYTLLELTAHGGEASKGGTLHYDFSALDSALQLVDLLLVKAEALPTDEP